MPPIPDPNTVDESFLALLGLSRQEFREIAGAQVEREKNAPAVGSLAPDFVAERLTSQGKRTGQRVRLSDLRGRPVALVFGSYTCPPFRAVLPRIAEIYDRHKDGVEFFLVYIREAHPDDGWQMQMNRTEGVVFDQPSTDVERATIARACIARFALPLPVLLDPVSNEIDRAYAAVPSKLYILDREGRIAYRSGPGPWEFDVDAWEAAIRDQEGRAEPGELEPADRDAVAR